MDHRDSRTSDIFRKVKDLIHRLPIAPHLADLRPLLQVKACSDKLANILRTSVDDVLCSISRNGRRAVLDIEHALERVEMSDAFGPAREVVHEDAVLEDGVLEPALHDRLHHRPLRPVRLDGVVRDGPRGELARREALHAGFDGGVEEREALVILSQIQAKIPEKIIFFSVFLLKSASLADFTIPSAQSEK